MVDPGSSDETEKFSETQHSLAEIDRELAVLRADLAELFPRFQKGELSGQERTIQSDYIGTQINFWEKKRSEALKNIDSLGSAAARQIISDQ